MVSVLKSSTSGLHAYEVVHGSSRAVDQRHHDIQHGLMHAELHLGIFAL